MIFLMQSSYFFIFIIYNAFQGHFHSNFFTGCKESHFHSLHCRQTVANMNFPKRHFILPQKRLDKQDLVKIYYTKGKSTKSFDTSRVHNIQKRSLKLEAFYNNLCLILILFPLTQFFGRPDEQLGIIMKIVLSHEKNDSANRAHIYVLRIRTLLGQSSRRSATLTMTHTISIQWKYN